MSAVMVRNKLQGKAFRKNNPGFRASGQTPYKIFNFPQNASYPNACQTGRIKCLLPVWL
jgi:hypothetical protein